jgi:hypothetical protein
VINGNKAHKWILMLGRAKVTISSRLQLGAKRIKFLDVCTAKPWQMLGETPGFDFP